MKLPRALAARTFAVVALSALLYGAVVAFVGWSELSARLATFPALLLIPLALLSLVNYALRYWRWELYLRHLGLVLPWRDSAGLYFATYVMVITPGKIGEVFKAGILKERYGASLALGLPIVLAERISDFLAVLLLAAVGIVFWPGPLTGLTSGLIAATAIPVVLVLCQWPPVRTRLVRRAAASPLLGGQVALDAAAGALSTLLGPRLGLCAMLLGTVAWASECAGLWLVCHGLHAPIAPAEAGFVYAAGTIVGSLSFLPGGLGGTEATIILLLESLTVPREAAGSAALLIRLFTLWLAVLVGSIFFLARRSLFRSP